MRFGPMTSVASSSINQGRAVPGGVVGFWPAMSVTFVDNHDTEWGSRDEEHRNGNDDTRHFPDKTVAMAYAYILTHPGIPLRILVTITSIKGIYTRERIDKLIKLQEGTQGTNSHSVVDIQEIAKPGLYAA